MIIKKMGIFIGTAGLIMALVIGCGSSNTDSNIDNIDNIDNNDTVVEIGSVGFTGANFSFILQGLAKGMLTKIGGDVMGNFLSLLGWGDSDNSDEEQTLEDIDDKLTEISDELVHIENQLGVILTEIKVSEDSIKNDVDWPRDAVNEIHTATQELQLLGVNTKPGEGDQTKIENLASDILGAKYDIPLQVISIYTAIEGNPTPLLSNYVDQVMLQLPNNDNDNLIKAYQGFEYYTSELLNNQIKGVNLVVEAYKAQDDNISAQKYLNCYGSNIYDTSECNILYKEIGDIDNKTSFIYNAVSMVLRDAPIYDPFLPTSAQSILARAEFYRLLMTGAELNEYGLHIFHISTADMEKSPNTLYVSKPGFQTTCNVSSSHTVKGREYDFWVDKTVKVSEDYNVAEYHCNVPNGEYSIFAELDKPLGTAEVSQYDTKYDLNSSGTISYGFGLVTNNISNRFNESSDKWTTTKRSDENYYSSTSGSANDWPIKAYASSNNQYHYESKAHIELEGNFYYDKDAEERTMHVAYYARFAAKVTVPYTSLWGGDAYTYVWVGVHDVTTGGAASDDCHYKSYYPLHAERDQEYYEKYYPDTYCTFTAIPGHQYYIYFAIEAKALAAYDGAVAESELVEVYKVNIKPSL